MHGAGLFGLGQLADELGATSAATAVSTDGSVVVGYANTLAGKQAFRWTSTGGMIGLGWLAGATVHSSEANGISADGQTVVGSSLNEDLDAQAFTWTTVEGMVGLEDPRNSNSSALGVSANGSVMVGRYFSASGFEACLWTAADGIVGLGDLPGGLYESAVRAASADGGVLAGYGRSMNGYEAFRWTQNGGMVGIGDLQGGIFDSSASGISSDGETIVGGSQSAQGFEAFRWTQQTGMEGLGDLPGGNFWSLAKGVGANGAMVVGQGESSNGREAFVWSPAQGMRRLWDALVTQNIDPASTGWSLLEKANAVSSDGRYVVGFGTRAGRDEAFLADLGPVETLEPEIGGFSYSSGTIGFQLTGITGFQYVVETSTDLEAWQPVVTNTAPFVFTSNAAADQPMVFLRALYLP